MKYILSLLIFLLLQSCTSTNEKICHLTDEHCTFVLFNENNNDYQIVNKGRAEQRFTPASTFKITNTLIALETGVVSGPEQALSIDKTKYPPQPWWQTNWTTQGYNLETAFKNSVFPIYQGIASDIGEESMSQYLAQFSYGNQNISSGIDNFWLNGSLKISALEQIQFLKNVYHNNYQFKEKTLEDLLTIMLVEETASYKLYAKTGASLMDDGRLIAWYVGFVENNEGVHYFVFNLQGEPGPETNQARIDFSRNHLKQSGLI